MIFESFFYGLEYSRVVLGTQLLGTQFQRMISMLLALWALIRDRSFVTTPSTLLLLSILSKAPSLTYLFQNMRLGEGLFACFISKGFLPRLGVLRAAGYEDWYKIVIIKKLCWV